MYVFFPKKQKVYFFSQEKFKIHSLTQIQKAVKKYSTRKKNTIFTHTVDFWPKMVKLNFSGKIKKYGTFAEPTFSASKGRL